MKRAVIAIAAIVLLAAGGGAGWWFFLRAGPPEEQAAATGEGEGGGEGLLTARFVDLEPMVLPILREGRVVKHLTIILSVELTKPTEKEKIAELAPRLRDSIFSELHGVYSFRHVQDAGYDVPVVKGRLVRAGERVIGSGGVKAVLVKAITVRTPQSG